MQARSGLVTSGIGEILPVAEPRLGDRTLNLNIPTAPVPGNGVGTKFLAIQNGGDGLKAGTVWVLAREVIDGSGGRTDTFTYTTGGLIRHVRTSQLFFNEGDRGYGPLAQLLDDPVARRLSDTYIGKPLWTFGRYVFDCGDPYGNGATVETRDRAPLYISSIYRVAHWFVRQPLGTGDPMYMCSGACHEAYHAFSDEPLLVIFAPRDADVRVIPPRIITHIYLWKGPCDRAEAFFLDDWDFERVFTLEDPRSAHTEWPAKFRKDLLDYRFEPGMDHAMVAFAAGYPSMFGKRDELDLMTHWEWYPTAGGSSSTYFDEAGLSTGGGGSWGP